ncbi:tetratricopeptide repeat protein [Ralstonia pickettii]|uniref:Tetratricopeptide repeat protein n=1 Tax=Ralstonia pickettii TaxID=329 RepID=A0A7X2HJT9_RALPI|nr:tetratricopeptide repeat protein [Ralstonia pickettii]MRS97860.1 tetratricopeptide repeat protein [Ralstonia pickettii]
MTRFPNTALASLAGVAMLATLLAGCGSMAASDMSLRTDADIEMARQRQSQEKAEITSPATYLALIRRMQEQGLYYASLAHIDAYQQRYGRGPEIMLLRADALRETDQLAAADAEYRAVVGATSALGAGTQGGLLNAAAWRGLGIVAGRQGNFAEAARRLQVAAQANPTDASTASDLGYALMRSGEVEQARVPLMQAQQMAATSPKIAGNLVIWLTVNDRKDDAASLAAHAQLTESARKAVDDDVARVRAAWRDRRIARETTVMGPRSVATGPSATASAGVSVAAAATATRTSDRPLALQRGRLLDTLEVSQ